MPYPSSPFSEIAIDDSIKGLLNHESTSTVGILLNVFKLNTNINYQNPFQGVSRIVRDNIALAMYVTKNEFVQSELFKI